jgi:hypothetical protein
VFSEVDDALGPARSDKSGMGRHMSIEQISDVVKMIAFVVAGLWAAWTFHKLQKVRAAELDNNRKLVETKKSKIEHEEIKG